MANFISFVMLALTSILLLNITSDGFHSPQVTRKRSNVANDKILSPSLRERRPKLEQQKSLSTDDTNEATSTNRRSVIQYPVGAVFTASVVASSLSKRKLIQGEDDKKDNNIRRGTDENDNTILKVNNPQIKTLSSINEAMTTLQKSCNRKFLHSVIASDYRFLYRGISSSTTTTTNPTITIRSEPHDLLSPSTYKTKEALRYFQELENGQLKDQLIRPSNGHLGTTNAKDASIWGDYAASVWPLGSSSDVHFAWYESGGEFWSVDGDGGGHGDERIIVDGRDCGESNLEDALRLKGGCEIMFRCDEFLAVPASLDEELRMRLKDSFLI